MTTDQLLEIKQAIQNENYDHAREVLRTLLASEPFAEVYYLASLCALDAEQEHSFLKQALALDPFHKEAYERIKKYQKQPHSENAKPFPIAMPDIEPIRVQIDILVAKLKVTLPIILESIRKRKKLWGLGTIGVTVICIVLIVAILMVFHLGPFKRAEQIVFVRDGDLYLVNSDGSDLHKLVSVGGQVSQPAWSLDGSQIAFIKNGDLWVVQSDGTDLQQLTEAEWRGCPAWLPDGNIVYGISGAYEDQPKLKIFDFEDDATSSRSIVWELGTCFATAKNNLILNGIYDGIRSSHYERDTEENNFLTAGTNPAISNNGKRLAYDFEGEIFIMNADGKQQENLTNSLDRESDPTLSPDGKKIAFEKNNQICVIELDDNSLECLPETVGGDDPAWRP